MAKLIYTNEKGQSLTFGDSAPLLVTKIDGLGSPKNEIYKQKAPSQDGTTHIDSTLAERNIVMEGVILAQDRQDRQKYRQELSSVFNPKQKGTLTFDRDGVTRKIDCTVETVEFPSAMQVNYQPFIVSLLCANPFWLEPWPYHAILAAVLPEFHFPLEIPPEGIELSTLSQGTVILDNPGDVPVPMLFEFRGPAENPCITNEATGEFILVRTPLRADERMIISTEFGNKRVEILRDDGTVINAFHYIDLGSTFWHLPVGKTPVHFSADVGSDDAEIYITYRFRYVGV